MVAKSYQKFELVGDPYEVSGRMYIKVATPKGDKQVRWYSENEYKKLYPDAVVDHSTDPYWKSQKEVLGFGAGFVWIFKGNTYPFKEWFKAQGATYRKWWGWAIPGEKELPEVLPEGVEALKLTWDMVGADHEKLLPDDKLAAVVESLLYDGGVSEFVGEIGDKIEVDLHIVNIVQTDGYYGVSNMYIMEDDCQNVFVWATAPRNWEVDDYVKLKGTVKDHKTYKNGKQTWLTRCRLVD